ncbi:hypothetical protein EDD16DRAFT_1898042 [Pisolithus croceorrhizus]|nr:hypothetical protein EDD16DRAFT_1898042 [Pisolithus croceorrhizus]
MEATLADETQHSYVGPVDPSQFLEDYLPCLNSTPATPCLSEEDLEALKGLATGTSAIDMYEQFQMTLGRCVRGMIFADTSSDLVKDTFPIKPDFALYEEGVVAPGEMDVSTAELCIELIPSMSCDPFEDTDLSKGGFEYPLERDPEEAKKMQGKITAYTVAQVSSQFRFFAFSVVVVRDHARFVRWDRAGAVASARFNYVENSNILVDFFWRFSHLSCEGRGHDPSVSPANLSEEDAQKIREILDLEAGTALFAFEVPHKDGNRLFYGPRFPFPVRSLIGQLSTRTVPVCDFVKGKPGKKALLKEYWRLAGMRGEVEFYEHLIKHDVPHIAPLSRRIHTLFSHRYLHRLVLGFVRRRLTQFKRTRELAVGIFHAMEAHWKAFEKARVLHRDISVNNILIDENGKGVLIDWALAVLLDDQGDSNVIERHDRMGTWQFMSAELLKNPGQIHTLQDDIESFVHVLRWTILCYLPGPMDEVSRKEWGVQTLGTFCDSAFRVRYCNPPTEGDKRLYDFVRAEFSEGLLTEEMLNADSMHKYTLCVERLKNSQWFLNTLEDALKRPDWPGDDAADANLLLITEGTSR